MSHEANIVNLVRDGFDDAIAGGWNLGDELIGKDLDEVIELLNSIAGLDVPLLDSGFFGTLTEIRQRNLDDLSAEHLHAHLRQQSSTMLHQRDLFTQ